MKLKDREFIGYSYDGADASFELLARRIDGRNTKIYLINLNMMFQLRKILSGDNN